MENSRRCEICNIDVHRASFAKHLRIKKHLENIRQDDIFKTEWLFKEKLGQVKNKIKKVYNPKPLKQIARENIELDDKELDNE